jgi:hypothetical protein
MNRIATIVLVLFCFNSMAQSKGKEDFGNETYFNIGYVLPNMDHVNNYNPQNVATKKMSAEIELGAIWNFRNVKLSNIARLGITADFLSLGCNYVTFQEAGYTSISKVITGRWSLNVGPNIAIRCFKDGFVDLFAKARATVVYDYIKTLKYQESGGMGFGFRYSIGANFRWRMLLIGGEAVFGGAKAIDYMNFTADVPDNYFKMKLGYIF